MDGDLTVQTPERIDGRLSYLRAFSERHLNEPNYLAWLRDYDVAKTIGRPEYLVEIPFKDAAAYVQRLAKSENDLFFAVHVAADDTFVGTVKAGHIDRTASIADIGVMIGDRAYWGRGIATDCVGTLCRYMFNDFGIRKLAGGVMGNNPAMARVFEKLGFRQEGCLRGQVPFEDGFVDHLLYGCFATDLVAATTPVAGNGDQGK